MRKKWFVTKTDKAEATAIARQNGISPLTASMLSARGFLKKEDIDAFIHGGFIGDPFELKDMDKAVAAINESLESGDKILIYGDYDADGVTATAELVRYFETQGADVDYYIPDRNTEGYGLNEEAVRKISARGVELIITVDNGVSAIKESELIYSLGMKLVITDHHKVPDVLPRAEAIVNPHRTDNLLAFDEWSGVGVAFKLICALTPEIEYEDLLEEYADLITIGTIGDVVSLVDENRVFVKKGLEKIQDSDSEGINALKKVAGIENRKITSTTVAFSLVPRLNAVGRVRNASQAVELLLTEDPIAAETIAEELNACNTLRQKTEGEITEGINAVIAEDPSVLNDRVLIFYGDNWHSGVVGIVAARLVEKYGKPCIVIGCDGEFAKGSGRSLEGFSLYDAINQASHLLTHFGGHTLAAGFSLMKEDIPEFKRIINDYAKKFVMPYPIVKMDFRLNPEKASVGVVDVFEELEPFGAGNPLPLVGLYDMKIESLTEVGSGKHLKFTLSSGSARIDAVKFSENLKTFPYSVGDTVDVAVKLDKNEYMGRISLSVQIREIKDSFTDDEKCISGQRLFEKLLSGEKLTQSELRRAQMTRDDAGRVYSLIREKGSIKNNGDLICLRLGDDGENYTRYRIAVTAMLQLGLIKETEGCLSIVPFKGKANLFSAPIFQMFES